MVVSMAWTRVAQRADKTGDKTVVRTAELKAVGSVVKKAARLAVLKADWWEPWLVATMVAWTVC